MSKLYENIKAVGFGLLCGAGALYAMQPETITNSDQASFCANKAAVKWKAKMESKGIEFLEVTTSDIRFWEKGDDILFVKFNINHEHEKFNDSFKQTVNCYLRNAPEGVE